MFFSKSATIAILALAPSAVLGRSTKGQAAAANPAAAAAAAAPATADTTGNSTTGASNIVTVGQSGNLQFVPNMMTVQQGDAVTFQFLSAAHAVMSTGLSAPNVADNQIYSGIMPVDNTTPTPPGKKLPKRSLQVRDGIVWGHEDEEEEVEKRDLAGILGAIGALTGGKAGGKAAKAGAATTVAQLGAATPAQFTVTMNTVGMQAIVCPAAQHAANGMIMMINVLPAGASKEKRDTSSAALEAALTNYLQVGQKTKTVPPTVLPGTGGKLNAVAAQVAQSQNKNGKANANTQGQIAAGSAGGP